MTMAPTTRTTTNTTRRVSASEHKVFNEEEYFSSLIRVQEKNLYSKIIKVRKENQKRLEESEELEEGKRIEDDEFPNDESTLKLFTSVFESELQRIGKVISSQQEAQISSAEKLITTITATNDYYKDIVENSHAEKEEEEIITMKKIDLIRSLRFNVKDISDMCWKLQQFVKRIVSSFREIAKYADHELVTCPPPTSSSSSSSSPLLDMLDQNLSTSPWTVEGPNCTTLMMLLSDLYELISVAENKIADKSILITGGGGKRKWIAPNSFNRSARKFWVNEDKVITVLLAAITEAPILVYEDDHNNNNEKDKNHCRWDTIATRVSTVYFDSDSRSVYKARLQKQQQQQTQQKSFFSSFFMTTPDPLEEEFRVRWYGENDPSGNDPIFLEFKRHSRYHKSSSNNEIKKRCTICEKDMDRFLNIPIRDWSQQIAKEMILNYQQQTSTTLVSNKEELQEQIELLTKMHTYVLCNELRPCVRSTYVRTAFQSKYNNNIRFTLDRYITFINETIPTWSSSSSSSTTSSWHLSQNDIRSHTTNIVRNDENTKNSMLASHLSHPVFEIKLNSGSEMPSIFYSLLKNGTLIEANDFSKFLSGSACFHPEKVC